MGNIKRSAGFKTLVVLALLGGMIGNTGCGGKITREDVFPRNQQGNLEGSLSDVFRDYKLAYDNAKNKEACDNAKNKDINELLGDYSSSVKDKDTFEYRIGPSVNACAQIINRFSKISLKDVQLSDEDDNLLRGKVLKHWNDFFNGVQATKGVINSKESVFDNLLDVLKRMIENNPKLARKIMVSFAEDKDSKISLEGENTEDIQEECKVFISGLANKFKNGDFERMPDEEKEAFKNLAVACAKNNVTYLDLKPFEGEWEELVVKNPDVIKNRFRKFSSNLKNPQNDENINEGKVFISGLADKLESGFKEMDPAVKEAVIELGGDCAKGEVNLSDLKNGSLKGYWEELVEDKKPAVIKERLKKFSSIMKNPQNDENINEYKVFILGFAEKLGNGGFERMTDVEKEALANLGRACAKCKVNPSDSDFDPLLGYWDELVEENPAVIQERLEKFSSTLKDSQDDENTNEWGAFISGLANKLKNGDFERMDKKEKEALANLGRACAKGGKVKLNDFSPLKGYWKEFVEENPTIMQQRIVNGIDNCDFLFPKNMTEEERKNNSKMLKESLVNRLGNFEKQNDSVKGLLVKIAKNFREVSKYGNNVSQEDKNELARNLNAFIELPEEPEEQDGKKVSFNPAVLRKFGNRVNG